MHESESRPQTSGKMRKKVWCNQGDIVLVSLRDFQAVVAPSAACFCVVLPMIMSVGPYCQFIGILASVFGCMYTHTCVCVNMR